MDKVDNEHGEVDADDGADMNDKDNKGKESVGNDGADVDKEDDEHDVDRQRSRRSRRGQ